MPVNNMTVGRDYDFGLYDGITRQIINLGDVQSFRVTSAKHNIKSSPYNGDPKFGYIPDGYTGSFSIVRTNQQLEELALTLNETFNSGGSVKSGYLNETVRNPDGSVSRYQYTGCVFWLTDVADGSREKNITQTCEFMASNKKRIA